MKNYKVNPISSSFLLKQILKTQLPEDFHFLNIITYSLFSTLNSVPCHLAPHGMHHAGHCNLSQLSLSFVLFCFRESCVFFILLSNYFNGEMRRNLDSTWEYVFTFMRHLKVPCTKESSGELVKTNAWAPPTEVIIQ